MKTITAKPITADSFAAYGDILDAEGEADRIINQGNCGRYHDRALMDFCDGRAGISIFKAKARSLPYTLEMMERHPLGSQAFVPMSDAGFLVIVAADNDGAPSMPEAFLTAPGQAINIHRKVWHGVLTPLCEPGLFAVIDRIGDGANLEEYWFDVPFTVVS